MQTNLLITGEKINDNLNQIKQIPKPNQLR